MIPNSNPSNKLKWCTEDKLRIVMETYSLNEEQLRYKDKALAETAALLVLKKGRCDLGGPRILDIDLDFHNILLYH